MSPEQPKNPLHGLTLKAILEDLEQRHGWDGLAECIPIRCFESDPSISSSLKFLRKTDWARRKVERLYLRDQRELRRPSGPTGWDNWVAPSGTGQHAAPSEDRPADRGGDSSTEQPQEDAP